MSTNPDEHLTTIQKAFLGAVGGLCLVLLKLIENNFYIGNPSPDTILGAYLTYAVFVFFGVVVAAGFAEYEIPPSKWKRHALLMGLFAPSILIALLTGPIGDKQNMEPFIPGLPSLGAMIFNTAHAGEPEQNTHLKTDPIFGVEEGGDNAADLPFANPQWTEAFEAIAINKNDVDVGVWNGVWSSFNRGNAAPRFAYVVGVSTDPNQAAEFASHLSIAIATAKFCAQENLSCVRVVSPQGSNNNFVMVGDFSTEQQAYRTRSEAWDAVIRNLENDKVSKQLASAVAGGAVVRGLDLFKVSDKPRITGE